MKNGKQRGIGDNLRQGRPEYDPELDVVLEKIKHMSPKEVATQSGGMIGAATVYNWRRGKVRCPLNYTVRAAYRAAGYELVLRKIKKP